jgi:hypothetical protein
MRSLLVSIFLFSMSSLIAQNTPATLTWGEDQRGYFFPNTFVGYDDKGNLIFIGAEETKTSLLGGGGPLIPALITYDSELNYKDRKELEIPKLKVDGETYTSLEDLANIKAINLQGAPWVIATLRFEDDTRIYAWRIDPLRKRLGTAKLIGTIQGMKKLRTDFEWSTSPNEQLGLLSLDAETRMSKDKKIYALVLDSAFEVRSETLLDLPYSRQEFEFESISVDNRGKVIATGLLDIPLRERMEKAVRTRPVMLVFTGSEKPVEINLQFENKKVQSLKSLFNPSGKGVAVGFYGNDSYQEQDGIFFATLNQAGQIEQASAYEFDLDFLTADMSDRSRKQLEKRAEKGQDLSANSFVMREINLLSDGSFVAIGEYFKVRTNTQTDRFGQIISYTVDYIYGDLVVSRFTPEGTVLWAKKIDRAYQTLARRAPFHYTRLIKDDSVYLLYQDRTSVKPYRNVDMLATIAPDGKVVEYPLSESKTDGSIEFASARQLSSSEVILIKTTGFTGRKKAAGRLKLKGN